MQDPHRFSDWQDVDADLAAAARITVQSALGMKRGERVLIVTNPSRDVSLITQALYDAATEAGGIVVLVYQPIKSQLDFAQPEIYAAMTTKPDIVISMSCLKIGKDRETIANPITVGETQYDSRYHWLLGTHQTRGFWSPAATVAMYKRAVPIDYGRLKTEISAVKGELDQADTVRITSPAGTDLIVGLRGRQAKVDDGDFSSPGAGGNLPAGETYISPELGQAHGTLVFDGSIATQTGTIMINTPIRTTVEAGRVVEITGGAEAHQLLASIQLGEQSAREFEREGTLAPGQGEVYAANARNLGELGIGLNPAALITGRMLEDEKAYRTCHIAIGSNYDHDADSLIHLDGLIRDPTITAVRPDGGTVSILLDGSLCIN